MDVINDLNGIRSLSVGSQNVRICWVFGAEENTLEKVRVKSKRIFGFRAIYSGAMCYVTLIVFCMVSLVTQRVCSLEPLHCEGSLTF